MINYFCIFYFPKILSCVGDNSLGRTKKYIEVSGRPGPTEFLSSQYSSHPDRYNLTFKIESLPDLDEIKLLYRKLMVTCEASGSFILHLTFIIPLPSLINGFLFSFDLLFPIFVNLNLSSPSSSLQMNETYQKPGKWNELILYPSVTRHDLNHFVMSYIIKPLEANSVFEVLVQAKNRYGWNEVSESKKTFPRN